MKKFTVVKAFELTPAVAAVEASEGVEAVEAKDAVTAEVDSVVELSEARAAELGEKVTPVEEV